MRPPMPAPEFKWDDAEKADALLAAVRARHAGLVEQQLRHLILTKALTQEDVWEKACQVRASERVCGAQSPGTL